MEEDSIAVMGVTASKDSEPAATQEEAPAAAAGQVPPAPPSTSSLSDLAPKEYAALERQLEESPAETSHPDPLTGQQPGGTATEPTTSVTNAMKPPVPGWEVATIQSMNTSMASGHPATPARGNPVGRPRGRGRAGKRVSLGGVSAQGDDPAIKTEDGATPGSTGRGRPKNRGGRPRGRGRGGTGRGGKRKRDDDDDEEEDVDSDSSDEVTPVATMTKSGRSIQKPTTFVPPPPSPTTNPYKRKKVYARRNPESAVCKICLRGTSPAANMIVFCDGCNAPYHRWCHKPPIDQAIIDEVDREWFCHHCESERVIPVPEAEVADFISAEGVSAEARQKYFSSLPPGMLVTLLTKATNLKPDLPLFPPDFRTKQQTNGSEATNGHAPTPAAIRQQPQLTQEEEGYGPDVHPPNYPRPGQGLMKTLPPEQEDLQWLVEDDDKYGVFTHVYRNPDPPAVAPPTSGVGAPVNAGASVDVQ